jgi:N-acylneuraminate cytidylyltransferase
MAGSNLVTDKRLDGMLKKAAVLAIVPARGGSASFPEKNIRSLGGIPLIAYSIAAGLQSTLVDRVIVSTDDNKVAGIAREWGGEIPFLRPAEFARDESPDIDFFIHALEWLYKNESYRPDIVVQLRPTSPLRPVGLVDEAVTALLSRSQAESVRGVVPAGQNPYKMWRIKDPTKPMQNLLRIKDIDEPYNAPRQTLPQIYWQTGQIDVIRTKTLLGGSVTGEVIYPLLIDPIFSLDIDSQLSLDYAEWLMSRLELPIVRPYI